MGFRISSIGVVRIVNGTATASLVSPYTKKDPVITAVISKSFLKMNKLYGRLAGGSRVELNASRDPGVRTAETNFGDLIADALLWEGQQCGFTPDAAIIHGGAIRTTLPKGTFTYLDIINVLPSFYDLYIANVTGEMLLKDLEANTATTPAAEGGFPQVSGITYTIDTGKPYVDGEVNRVTITSVGGKPFNRDAIYQIVSTEQLLTGGDKYQYMITAPKTRLPATYDDALIRYIQEHLGYVVGYEYEYPQGRITIISSASAADATAANMTLPSPAAFVASADLVQAA